MAERRPLVVISGEVAQLPSGDTIAGIDYPMIKASIPPATTVTIPTGYQMLVGPDFQIDGDLVIDGELIAVG